MKKGEPPKIVDIEEEERELFLNAFYQNISIEDKKASEGSGLKKKAPRQEESDEELFLRAVHQSDLYSFTKTPQSKVPRKPPAAKKRDSIDACIDLHGLFAEEAVARLLKFISAEKARGSRLLLVVHGKGAGVLKNAVWSIAETSSLVDDFSVAPGKYGGHGAIFLRINRKYRR